MTGTFPSLLGSLPSPTGSLPSPTGSLPSPTGRLPSPPGHCPIALGHCPIALGHCPIALGHCHIALGHCPIALGHRPIAPGHRPIAPGRRPIAPGRCPSRLRALRIFLSTACIFFPEKRTPSTRSIERGQEVHPAKPGEPPTRGRRTHGRMVRSGGPRSPEGLPHDKQRETHPKLATKTNSSITVAKCTQRSAAAQQYVPKKGTILVHSQPYTQQQVETVYQTCLDTRQTLVNLRGQVAAALVAKNQADAAMNTFDTGMRDWVATTFGPKSQQAIDFGYARKPPAKPTVSVKATAQSKAKATRAARGTTGPKQRKKVTAPVVASPAPTTAPAPVTPAPATPKS